MLFYSKALFWNGLRLEAALSHYCKWHNPQGTLEDLQEVAEENQKL
jgi:hypothetical protein